MQVSCSGYYVGCGLILALLACGCQQPGGSTAGSATLPPGVEATSAQTEDLNKTVANAGFNSADLALQTVLSFPLPADAKRKQASWKGAFSGSAKAALQATDRILVVARSIDVPHLRFNAYSRTWETVSDLREKNWQQVWFSGTVKAFLRVVENDRSSRRMLASLNDSPTEPVFRCN